MFFHLTVCVKLKIIKERENNNTKRFTYFAMRAYLHIHKNSKSYIFIELDYLKSSLFIVEDPRHIWYDIINKGILQL